MERLAPTETDKRIQRERFARAEALFMEALEHPTDQRPAWLAAACGGDDLLESEVSALLAHDNHDSPGLRSPAERLQADDELAEGALIDGRYRIGERLGAGGLGVVHRAEQLEPVRRDVALKVGRRGLDDAAALALFQAESRALSLVSHPGIAQVYDAGRTPRGRFYVAMELVDGVPLTTYCAQNRLDLAARLRLFIDICRAVQHAHQRGVIHRDLKPSNVLVTRHGDVAWPKVIDFGIAQATGSETSDAVEPIAGTPAYMSPEQAQPHNDGGPLDVDTRADVYSLGVMLYELLTGALPFVTSAATRRDLPALRDVLRGPLVLPSARTRGAPGPDAALSAPLSVPPIAAAALKGDIDSVVAKAMAHDRAARYAAVSELAADVDHVLHKLPVSARPHTPTYLLGSFVRRRRVLVSSIVALLAGVVAASVMMANLSSDRAEQRRIAEREAASAQAQREIAESTSRLAERLLARSLLNAASAAFDAGDAGTTRANLDAIPVAHRGFEWHYLHLEADRSDTTLSVSGPAITAMAVAAEAQRLFVGDAGGDVSSWPARSASTSAIRAHAAAVAALASSPDGTLLVTSDLDNSARAWEVESGVMLWERRGVVSLSRGAFSPDGTRVALGAFGDHAVSIHDAMNGKVLDRITIVAPTAYRPAWVGAGAVVFTDLSRTMRLDLARRELDWTVPSRLVELAGRDRFVARTLPNYVGWALFDAVTGAELSPFDDLTAFTETLDVTRSGGYAAMGGASTVLTLHALGNADTEKSQALPGHLGAITAVVFAPDDERVFTGDAAGGIKAWRASTLTQPYTAPCSNDVVYSGATSPDGAHVVTGGWGAVKSWDAVLGVELWTRLVGRAYISAVAFDPSGSAVAVGDWRGVVRVLEIEDGAERTRAELGEARVFALAWAPDGRLVVGREDGSLVVLDLASGTVEQTVAAHHGTVRALVFSPDGKLVASGSGGGAVRPVINEERPDEGNDATVRLWRWPGLEPVAVMHGHRASVRSLAFAPDGRRLVSGGSDRTVRAWSVPDGAPLVSRVGVGHEVSAVGFTADGTRLVTAHGEGPLLIWDGAELDLLMSLRSGHGHVLSASFTPDGKALTAVGGELAVVRFETERVPSRQQARVEVRAARALIEGLGSVLSSKRLVAALASLAGQSQAVVQRAIDMVRARGDHALMLNSAAWGRVLTAGQATSSLEQALQQSAAAVEARPTEWQSWNTLALARYRVGQLEEAWQAAEHGRELRQRAGVAHLPVVDAVDVLILAALGRTGDARALLEVTRPALQRNERRLDHESFALFAEAEAAVELGEAKAAKPDAQRPTTGAAPRGANPGE